MRGSLANALFESSWTASGRKREQRSSQLSTCWKRRAQIFTDRMGITYGMGSTNFRVRVSRVRYRVLYFFWKRGDIVLTHGITKKTGRVPETEIDRAVQCREDWLRRHDKDA